MAKARQQMGIPVLVITPYCKLYPEPAVSNQTTPSPEAEVDKVCVNDNGTQAAATLKAVNAIRECIKLLEDADPTNSQLLALRKDLVCKEAAAAKFGTKSTAAQYRKNLQAAMAVFVGQQQELEETCATAHAKSKETLQTHLAVADRYIEYFTNFKLHATAAQEVIQKQFDAQHADRRAYHDLCRLVFEEHITKAEAAVMPAGNAAGGTLDIGNQEMGAPGEEKKEGPPDAAAAPVPSSTCLLCGFQRSVGRGRCGLLATLPTRCGSTDLLLKAAPCTTAVGNWRVYALFYVLPAERVVRDARRTSIG
jgi:hypothetical protein